MDDKNIAKMRRLWNSSLSEHDLKTKTWDQFKVDSQDKLEIVKRVKAWDPSCGFGLFLCGTPGGGKTHMLKAMIIEHASESRPFLFLELRQLMTEAKRFGDVEAMYHYQHRFEGKFGLVLDDFGKETATDFEQGQLLDSLNKAIRNDQRVFMTSNLTFKEIKEKYDPAIISRLKEMMTFIEVGLPDHRNVIGISHKRELEARIARAVET